VYTLCTHTQTHTNCTFSAYRLSEQLMFFFHPMHAPVNHASSSSSLYMASVCNYARQCNRQERIHVLVLSMDCYSGSWSLMRVLSWAPRRACMHPCSSRCACMRRRMCVGQGTARGRGRGGGGRPANRRTGVRPGAGTHMAAHA